MKTLFFLTLFSVATFSATRAQTTPSIKPDSVSAPVDTSGRPEYFYFQTTGTPKFLLSEKAREAVLAAAKLSGYTEDEIEVTIYVADKVSKGKKLPAASRKKLSKPKVKKFE